jgi:hypothetical protein
LDPDTPNLLHRSFSTVQSASATTTCGNGGEELRTRNQDGERGQRLRTEIGWRRMEEEGGIGKVRKENG